jgi:hypothetical protein
MVGMSPYPWHFAPGFEAPKARPKCGNSLTNA